MKTEWSGSWLPLRTFYFIEHIVYNRTSECYDKNPVLLLKFFPDFAEICVRCFFAGVVVGGVDRSGMVG